LRLVGLDLEQNISWGKGIACSEQTQLRLRAGIRIRSENQRTFLDFPGSDVAFGHGGRQGGHGEVARGTVHGRGMEA